MVMPIVRDVIFLARKSVPATEDDLHTAQDLLDTLIAHADECVGMAANMIGASKRIIAFDNEGSYTLMLNPVIIHREEPYETEEGCLSLTGTRKTKRWRHIRVRYNAPDFSVRIREFSGWTAQIIQHEIDHCDGIII